MISGKREQRRCQGRAMEKSRYVRVIKGEEVKEDDPIEYFLFTKIGSTF